MAGPRPQTGQLWWLSSKSPQRSPRASFLVSLLIPRVGLGADQQEDRLSGSPSLSYVLRCSVTKWPERGSSFLLVMGRHVPFT